MFKTRLLSGIVLVIVLIATVGYGGNLLFAFLAVISVIGMTELYKVVGVQGKALGFAGYLAAVLYYGLLYGTYGVCDHAVNSVPCPYYGSICIYISGVSGGTGHDSVLRVLLCGGHALLCIPDQRACGRKCCGMADLLKLLGVRYLRLLCGNADRKA